MDNNLQNLNVDQKNIIIISDEEGKDHQCVILDIMEFKNKSYASLVPYEVVCNCDGCDNEDKSDLFIMEIEYNDDGEYFKSISDDDYEEICQLMIKRISDEFDVECED